MLASLAAALLVAGSHLTSPLGVAQTAINLADSDLKKAIQVTSASSKMSNQRTSQLLTMTSKAKAECQKTTSLQVKIFLHSGFWAYSQQIAPPESFNLPEGCQLVTFEMFVIENGKPIHYMLEILIFSRENGRWKLFDTAGLEWRQKDPPPLPKDIPENCPAYSGAVLKNPLIPIG